MLFQQFGRYPGLVATISTRHHGSMNIGNGQADASWENYAQFLQALEIDPWRVIRAKLVHGTGVCHAGEPEAGSTIVGVDGLITRRRKLFLAVTSGDCLPIFFLDPDSGTVGLAHAGWKGLIRGMARMMVHELKDVGIKPGRLSVGIGPAISASHYEVTPDWLEQNFSLRNRQGYATTVNGKTTFNLKGFAYNQLIDAGVNPSHIQVHGSCTYSDDRYFSFRREPHDPPQVMVSIIGWRS
ncbi:MAG: polyphenol oxidase family protein [Candidatus Kerfeldbacteria bacterium]|nr:polyphenol oxidase family protein [Candidatus Kerfeldbacteria bacterium]